MEEYFRILMTNGLYFQESKMIDNFAGWLTLHNNLIRNNFYGNREAENGK